MDDSDKERRKGERRTRETRAPRERRASPGHRIWIRRSPDDEADEVEEDNRVGERRSETPQRSGTLRRKDQRRKGSQRLD